MLGSIFLEMAFEYLLKIRNASGQLVYTTRRKTGCGRFLLAIRSIKGIFQEFVESGPAPLQYLLTYRLSQDHLKLFFGAIRSAGGFNNNPTAQQFTAAYKRLLLRSSIGGSRGNCQQRDQSAILQTFDDTCNVNKEAVTICEASLIRKYDLQEGGPVQSEHDYRDMPNFVNRPEYKVAALSYNACYVAKMAIKKILCEKCCQALGAKNHQAESRFLKLKDRGGLLKPTQSVMRVCEETEQSFQQMIATTGGNLPQGKFTADTIRLILSLIDQQWQKIMLVYKEG